MEIKRAVSRGSWGGGYKGVYGLEVSLLSEVCCFGVCFSLFVGLFVLVCLLVCFVVVLRGVVLNKVF